MARWPAGTCWSPSVRRSVRPPWRRPAPTASWSLPCRASCARKPSDPRICTPSTSEVLTPRSTGRAGARSSRAVRPPTPSTTTVRWADGRDTAARSPFTPGRGAHATLAPAPGASVAWAPRPGVKGLRAAASRPSAHRTVVVDGVGGRTAREERAPALPVDLGVSTSEVDGVQILGSLGFLAHEARQGKLHDAVGAGRRHGGRTDLRTDGLQHVPAGQRAIADAQHV